MKEPLKIVSRTEIAQCLESTPPRINRFLNANMEDDPIADLPIAQARFLKTLAESPKTATQMSEELGLTLSAVVQMAQKLVDADWIEKMPDDHDRRIKVFRLSHNGAQALDSRKIHRLEQAQKLLSQLSDAEVEQLHSALVCLTNQTQVSNKNAKFQIFEDLLENI